MQILSRRAALALGAGGAALTVAGWNGAAFAAAKEAAEEIAKFTGGTTDQGFDLQGGPALLLFGLVILYFIAFRRFLGGTVFQRLLGAR